MVYVVYLKSEDHSGVVIEVTDFVLFTLSKAVDVGVPFTAFTFVVAIVIK